MTWVKRGGGAGRGMYGNGLAAAVESRPPAATAPLSPPHEGKAAGVDAPRPSGEPAVPMAYRPRRREDMVDSRTLLEVLARYVREGGEAEMAMIYQDALETFGAESKHFIAACRGQGGAALHYQQTVAGGRYADDV